MSFIIQLRRDTAANWTSRNPVLHSGELGVEIDTGKAKFGDGTTSWSTLSYWNPGSSLANPMTTIGDLIVAGTGGSPARLARGSSGQVLSVGPSGSVGWSTPTARVNAVTQFGATTSGDSTTAIQNALLSFGTLAGWNGTGGVVYLPPGDYATSRPLIIPAGVWLVGDGWSSIVDLTTGSDCDVIQFASYQSASQAAILGVSASAIGNAFYAGIADLQIHGDAFHTTVAGYRHGVSITLNPGTSIAPTDPEFDPLVAIRNVYIKGCTGDGINHSGRSGAYFERVYSAFHNGCAFAPSFDTTMVDCLAAFCNSGFYMNHGSNVGTGCKSYNHNDYTWVSGHSYAPNAFGGIHTMAIDNGQMYFCIAATSGTTAPHLDPSHWTAVSATAPQANGTGYYWDTNAGEQSWAACDSQENSTSNFYLKGPSNGGSGIIIQATSSEPNFNNGQPAFSTANPNNYSHVVFDGVQSATVHISTTGTAARNPVVCRSLNNPSNHVLTATTDGSESAVFVGGTPKYSMINGTIISNGNATFNGTLVTAHNTVDDGSGNATFNGTLATAHNTLDDGTGKSVFNGNVKVNGALDINAGGFSTTPLVSSADGTTSSHGALVHVIGGNGTESGHYLLWFDATDPAYLGLSMALGAGLTYNGHPVIALGGYYNGWGVQGSSHGTGVAVFGVLNSNESGRNVSFRVDDNDAAYTKNNTLDDGSGNASVAGTLEVDGTVTSIVSGGSTFLGKNSGGPAYFTLTGAGDGAQYSNFNLADGIYPLDQNPGGHYWAFSHRVSAHALEIFNYDGAGGYLAALQMYETGEIDTAHNKLDDGAGNMTVSGALSVAGTKIPALVATTGDAGFALQNGTPVILTWTAPADGHKHRVSGTCMIQVTSGETGGAVTYQTGQINGANIPWAAVDGGGNDVSVSRNTLPGLLIDPGSTVSLVQSSALTAGAATVWAELWAS